MSNRSAVMKQTLIIAVACSVLAGCGGQSPHAAVKQDAGVERIFAVCQEATQKLVGIAGHLTPTVPDLAPLDAAAAESAAVDRVALAQVQAVHATSTAAGFRESVITNLKRSEAALAAFQGRLRRGRITAETPGVSSQYFEAAGGCVRVHRRQVELRG
jgi:hypothetical protein